MAFEFFRDHRLPVEGGAGMNTFARVERDPRQDQLDREMLLGQPPEFFQAALGDSPNPLECLQLVETTVRNLANAVIYVNDTYRVRIRTMPPFIHIAINRHDDAPCTNWHDFQQIKNELVGPECEAVELFPAESRLIDTANEYHLYVMPDAKYRFPFGYERRLVLEQDVATGTVKLPRDRQAAPMDSAALAMSH